ncbi:alkylhydroperoxidase [Bordetella genomosp. 8]|uniref:Alkylhydroperoxidase n=1 Tax=Bordetella genomosp. 8 TaxID=1416806 RepID=A0A1W6YQJ4_9BORD|nr:carboxymuconolactone decarboxylase family protein [Bordetella genomosp. 8]ARP83199.1 alkylhydroperoxidase [Bordetella genomosp. 8]
MSRIAIPAVESATGATAELYAQIKKANGKLPNLYATLGHLTPASLSAYLAAEAVLARASLPRQDVETIKVLVSELSGCDYCLAAHMMLGKMAGLDAGTLHNIRAGEPTGDAKRDALVRFVRVIQQTSGTLPAAEVDAIRAAGYTDAQLADIAYAYAMITYTNTFNRINDTDVDFPPVK